MAKKVAKFCERLKAFFKKYLFNPTWRCASCGREIFEDEYFCKDCYKALPFNSGAICDHCGRQTIASENYCSTCKNVLVSLDKCRSVFNYEGKIAFLIKQAKYENKKYLLDYFASELTVLYKNQSFTTDIVTCVPMTKKALKKRGYNQSKILAQTFAKNCNLPFIDCLVKEKETSRQATLSRQERRKNLQGVFRVAKRKEIKDKSVLLIDDVTTTGSTAEIIAKRLKGAGAKAVYLLTIASVPPIDKY